MTPPSGEVFRTYGGTDLINNWRLLRNTGWGAVGDVTQEMGRVYTNIGTGYVYPLNPNYGFNIQETRQGGTLWLRNHRNVASGTDVNNGNGLRLIDDTEFDLNGYTHLPRDGYVAIGDAVQMDAGLPTPPQP